MATAPLVCLARSMMLRLMCGSTMPDICALDRTAVSKRPWRSLCLSIGETPHSLEPIADLCYPFSIPFISFRRYRNISTTKINPNHLVRLYRFRSFVFQLNVQIKLAVSMLAKLSASRLPVFELASLITAKGQGDMLSPSNQGQAGTPILLPEGKDSRVIVSASRPEGFNVSSLRLAAVRLAPTLAQTLTARLALKPNCCRILS